MLVWGASTCLQGTSGAECGAVLRKKVARCSPRPPEQRPPRHAHDTSSSIASSHLSCRTHHGCNLSKLAHSAHDNIRDTTQCRRLQIGLENRDKKTKRMYRPCSTRLDSNPLRNVRPPTSTAHLGTPTPRPRLFAGEGTRRDDPYHRLLLDLDRTAEETGAAGSDKTSLNVEDTARSVSTKAGT